MRVFIDASAWVALADARDYQAPRMRVLMADLRRKHAQFATTNWTLYEALAVSQRAGKGAAIDLHRRALRLARLVFVSHDEEREALRRFLDWDDKYASVVDHANVLVASRQRCDAIVSFDSDFVPLAGAAGLTLLR